MKIRFILFILFFCFGGLFLTKSDAWAASACDGFMRRCASSCGKNDYQCFRNCDTRSVDCYNKAAQKKTVVAKRTTAKKPTTTTKPRTKSSTKSSAANSGQQTTSAGASSRDLMCEEQVRYWSTSRRQQVCSAGPPNPNTCDMYAFDKFCRNMPDSTTSSGGVNADISAAVNTCESLTQQAKANCDAKLESAKGSCDEENDSMSELGRAAANITQGAGAMTASSVAASCQKTAQLISGANAALAAWRINCKSNRGSCMSACQDVRTQMNECASQKAQEIAARYYQNASEIKQQILDQLSTSQAYSQSQDARKECVAMDAKIQEAERAIVNYAGTLTNAQQCGSLTAAAVPDFCKSNPNASGCKQTTSDCSDPANASNKICICQKNPQDPTCGTSSEKVGGFVNGNGASGATTSSTGGGGLDGALDQASSGMNVEGGAPRATSGDAGGGGGGAGLGGGGSGGLGAGDESGDYASDEPMDINAGFYGAGGTGGGANLGGGGGYAVGPDGEPLRDENGQLIYDGVRGGHPDLSRFLPGQGGVMPEGSGLSGMTGPDGITGPHTNIWHKINNRYREKEPTLMKE